MEIYNPMVEREFSTLTHLEITLQYKGISSCVLLPFTFLSDFFVSVYLWGVTLVLYSLKSDCLVLHSDVSFYISEEKTLLEARYKVLDTIPRLYKQQILQGVLHAKLIQNL